MNTFVAYKDPQWAMFPFVAIVRHTGFTTGALWTVHDRDTLENAPPSRGLHLCGVTQAGEAYFPEAALTLRRLEPMLTRFGLPTNKQLMLSADDVDLRVMALCSTCGKELANVVRGVFGRLPLCTPNPQPVD